MKVKLEQTDKKDEFFMTIYHFTAIFGIMAFVMGVGLILYELSWTAGWFPVIVLFLIGLLFLCLAACFIFTERDGSDSGASFAVVFLFVMAMITSFPFLGLSFSYYCGLSDTATVVVTGDTKSAQCYIVHPDSDSIVSSYGGVTTTDSRINNRLVRVSTWGGTNIWGYSDGSENTVTDVIATHDVDYIYGGIGQSANHFGSKAINSKIASVLVPFNLMPNDCKDIAVKAY